MDGPHSVEDFVDRSYAYKIIVEVDSCTAARVIGKLTGDTSLNARHCDRFAVELFKWYPDVFLAPEGNMYAQHPHQSIPKKRTAKKIRRNEQRPCKSRTAAPRLTPITPCEAKTAIALPKEEKKMRSVKKKKSHVDLNVIVTRSRVPEKKSPADWTIPSNISDRKLRPLLDFTSNKMKTACKSFHDNMLQNFQGLKAAIRERRGILSFRRDRRPLTDDEDNAGYRKRVSKSSANNASGKKNIVTSASVPHITSLNLSVDGANNVLDPSIGGSVENADRVIASDYPENINSKSDDLCDTDTPTLSEPDAEEMKYADINTTDNYLQERRKCNDFMSDVKERYRPATRVSSNVALLLLNLQANRVRSRSMSTLNSYHLDKLFTARDDDHWRYSNNFSTSGGSRSKCDDEDKCGIKCKIEKFCQRKKKERERRIDKAKTSCKKLFKTEDSSSCGAKAAGRECGNKTKCKETAETRKPTRKRVKCLSVQHQSDSEPCKKTRKREQQEGVPCTLPASEKGCTKKRSAPKKKCGRVKCQIQKAQSSCEKRSERSCGRRETKCKNSNVDDVPKRFSSCGKGDEQDPCKKYRKDENQGPPCKDYKKDDMSRGKDEPCKKYIHDDHQGPSCKKSESKDSGCDPCRKYRTDEHQGPPCKPYEKDEMNRTKGEPCKKYIHDEHQGPSCKKDNSKKSCEKKDDGCSKKCTKSKCDKKADSKCSDIKRVEPCKKKECPPVIKAPGCPDEGKKGGGGGSSPCKNRKFSTLTAEHYAKELLIKTPWQLWNIRRSLSSNVSSTDGYHMQQNYNLDYKSETRENIADTPGIDVFGILSMDDV